MATPLGLLFTASSEIYSAYAQSSALQSQARYQESMSRINQELAGVRANRVIEKGEKESVNYRKKVNQMVGTQRANLAAQGLDPNSGTALDLQTETALIGSQDALQIKNNAWLEAWGIKTAAMNEGYQSQFESMGKRNASTNTLITGGLQAAGTLYSDKGKTTGLKKSTGHFGPSTSIFD